MGRGCLLLWSCSSSGLLLWGSGLSSFRLWDPVFGDHVRLDPGWHPSFLPSGIGLRPLDGYFTRRVYVLRGCKSHLLAYRSCICFEREKGVGFLGRDDLGSRIYWGGVMGSGKILWGMKGGREFIVLHQPVIYYLRRPLPIPLQGSSKCCCSPLRVWL